MASIHKLRKLGEDSGGAKLGIELPRDDLRLERLIDRDGDVVDRPDVAISRVSEGEWRIERLDKSEVSSASD